MAETLTDKQRKYVEAIIEGAKPSTAAKIAGYSNPNQDSYRLSITPHIQQTIVQRMNSRFMTQGVPLALRVLFDVLEDDEKSPKLRVEVAKYVVDKADSIAKMQGLQDINDKNVTDMSEAELHLFISKGRVILREHTKSAQLKDLGIIEAELTDIS